MTISIWTPELKQEVCLLWRNYSSTEICEIFADRGLMFTRNQIIGMAHRAGLSSKDKIKEHPQTRLNGQRAHPKPRSKLKIVNGGLGSMRVIHSVETDMPKTRVVPIVPRNLTLAELRSDECHFIPGEPNEGYCGHPVSDGSPYCSHHKAIMYVPWIKRRVA